MLSPDKLLDTLRSGATAREASAEIGCSLRTASKYRRALGLSTSRSEIARQRGEAERLKWASRFGANSKLTPRQRELQQLVRSGMTTKAAAEVMGITYATARIYRIESRLDYARNRRRCPKLKAIDYSGGCCLACTRHSSVRALTFHHIDPNIKQFAIREAPNRANWAEIKAELDKTILLCHSCHEDEHDGIPIVTPEMIARQRELRDTYQDKPYSHYLKLVGLPSDQIVAALVRV